MGKGWHYDSAEHALAAKGLKSGRKSKTTERLSPHQINVIVHKLIKQFPDTYPELDFEGFYREEKKAIDRGGLAGEATFQREGNVVTLNFKDKNPAMRKDKALIVYLSIRRRYPNVAFSLEGDTIIARG